VLDADGSFLVIDQFAGTCGCGELFGVYPATGQWVLLSDFGNAAPGPHRGPEPDGCHHRSRRLDPDRRLPGREPQRRHLQDRPPHRQPDELRRFRRPLTRPRRHRTDGSPRDLPLNASGKRERSSNDQPRVALGFPAAAARASKATSYS
jgi:hypothetical protein